MWVSHPIYTLKATFLHISYPGKEKRMAVQGVKHVRNIIRPESDHICQTPIGDTLARISFWYEEGVNNLLLFVNGMSLT